jgi:hypothetical protein
LEPGSKLSVANTDGKDPVLAAPLAPVELGAVGLALKPDTSRIRVEVRGPESDQLVGILVCVVLKTIGHAVLGEASNPPIAQTHNGWIGIRNRDGIAVPLVPLTDVHAYEVAEARLTNQLRELRQPALIRGVSECFEVLPVRLCRKRPSAGSPRGIAVLDLGIREVLDPVPDGRLA